MGENHGQESEFPEVRPCDSLHKSSQPPALSFLSHCDPCICAFCCCYSGSTIHAWTGKLDISLVTLARAFFPLTYPAHGPQVHLSKRPSLSCCPTVGTYSYRLSSHIVEVPSHWQDLNSGGGGAGVHCK